MALQTGGLHHLALRVADLERAKAFYVETLGFPLVLEREGVVAIINVGGTFVGSRGPDAKTAAGDRFDPFRVGLDHLALAMPDAAALQAVARQLDEAGVPNNGVEHDAVLGSKYISFYDPDGIAWELYASPAQ